MKGLLFKTTKILFLPVFFVMAGSIQTVLADETIDVSEFQDCRAIKGMAERLLCYDTIADGGVFNTQKLEQAQQETFGNKQQPSTISVDSLNVTVVKTQKDGTGRIYFFTDGGQVWKQAEVKRYSTSVPFEAKIDSGVMGSFFLVNHKGRGTRVERVR